MNINYRIKTLDEVSFSMNYDFHYELMEDKNVTYQFSQNIEAVSERSEIVISLQIFINYGEDNVNLLKEVVRTSFGVDPYDSLIRTSDDNGFAVSEPMLIDTFVNITIGAARGMIAKNVKGTPLAGCILPLIPMDVIRNLSKR